jgi:thioesterase domain-containing protein/acyl carrier protein
MMAHRDRAAPPVGGADPVESVLLRIWAEVLGVEAPGIHDDFFASGGQPFTAVQLFAKIEDELGVNLPISILLQRPTIAQVAELIERGGNEGPWPSLVPVQHGVGPALFCIHGVRGDAIGFRELAKRLGPDCTVYGLRARGLDGFQTPCNRVEEMAAHYAAEIVEAQPRGPYFLIGYSMGGLVAYEIARQLRNEGREVGLVGLIDTRRHLSPPLQFINVLLQPLDQKIRFFRSLWRRVKRSSFAARVSDRAQGNRALVSRLQRIHRVRSACLEAVAHYTPQRYDGRVTMFRGSGSLAPVVLKLVSHPWETLAAGGVDLQKLPCTHESILKEPDVGLLAVGVVRCMEAWGGMPE